MTDREIVEGLIARDNEITRQFLFVKCRPLLTSILNLVFNYKAEYDELVNELYGYLMENDGEKLRQFQYRSSIYQWLKVVAARYFIRKRDLMLEQDAKMAQFEKGYEGSTDPEQRIAIRIDIEKLLHLIPNRRYSDVISHLIFNDEDPETYAKSIGVSVDNLYNIKRRAISALTQVALKTS